MIITLHLPEDAEETIRRAWGDQIDRATLEALVIDGYRTGKLGISQVRRLLGLESRWDAQKWLGERGIPLNYSLEDFETDQRNLTKLLGEDR